MPYVVRLVSSCHLHCDIYVTFKRKCGFEIVRLDVFTFHQNFLQLFYKYITPKLFRIFFHSTEKNHKYDLF